MLHGVGVRARKGWDRSQLARFRLLEGSNAARCVACHGVRSHPTRKVIPGTKALIRENRETFPQFSKSLPIFADPVETSRSSAPPNSPRSSQCCQQNAFELCALALREPLDFLLRHRLQPRQKGFHLPLRSVIGQDEFLRLRPDDVGHPVVQARRAPPGNGESAERHATAPFDFRQRLPARFHRAPLLTPAGFPVSGRPVNPSYENDRSRCPLRDHAIGDVNASFARIKGACVSLEAPATHRIAELLRRCSRWTSRPSLLATMPARAHHTVQFWRLGITVEMWTRCGRGYPGGRR